MSQSVFCRPLHRKQISEPKHSPQHDLFGLAQLHSSITVENREDLERVQKTVLKIILDLRYKSYQNALDILELETLEKRREKLCLNLPEKQVNIQNARTCFHSMKRYIKWRQEGPQNSKFWMQILNVWRNHRSFFYANFTKQEWIKKVKKEKYISWMKIKIFE